MPSAKWRPFCLGLNVLNQIRGKFGYPSICYTEVMNNNNVYFNKTFMESACYRNATTILVQNMWAKLEYRQFSNISCTQSQNTIVSHLVLQLSLPNPLKPCVKLRMKM